MEVSQARERYVHWLKSTRDLSSHTIRAYATDVAAFDSHLGCSTLVADVSDEQIVSFIESMRATPLSPKTIRRRASGVRGFCGWLVAEQLLETDPWLGIQVAAGKGRMLPRFVASDDLDRLIVVIRGRVERAGRSLAESVLSNPFESTTLLGVALMVSTGVRVSELTSIDCRDIDIAGRSVRITGKGRRERFVYLANDWVAQLTIAYLTMRDALAIQHRRLLLNNRGAPLTAAAMRSRLGKLASDARLSEKVTPHMLRHTAATQLLEAGVDIRLIQRLLGHASLSTTEIYTHVSNPALQRVVEEADVLGRVLQRG